MGRARSFDESAVLDAVRDQFWAGGYDGTSTYDLMDVTNLGKGSLYHAYGSKRDLYMRVFARYCDELVAAAHSALSSQETGSPRDRLERYLATLAEIFGSQSPRRGCFLTNGTTDLANTDEGVAAVAREAFARIALALAGAVKDAQAAGEVSSDADADSLGYVLLSVIRGMSCMAKADVPASTLTDIEHTTAALLPRP